MRAEEYAAMYAVEDEHWWYVGMRRVADALLRGRVRRRAGPLRILDAGCGTGGNSAHLRRYGDVTGVDFSADALRFARERPGLRLGRASVQSLPFADGSFDLVLSNDVLCHLGVTSEPAALREFARVLRPGGLLFLQLPAYEWLKSHHDEAVHTGHRYTASEVRRLLQDGGLRVRRLTYANGLLLPAAAAWRVLNRVRPTRTEVDRSDVRPVAGPLNALMRMMLGLEARFLTRRNLPAGLSVIAVAQREVSGVRSQASGSSDAGAIDSTESSEHATLSVPAP